MMLGLGAGTTSDPLANATGGVFSLWSGSAADYAVALGLCALILLWPRKKGKTIYFDKKGREYHDPEGTRPI